MKEEKQEDTETANSEQVWKDLLEILNKQLGVSSRLKEIIEPLAGVSFGKEQAILSEKTSNEIRELFIELEALQAEERPIYHSLFETEDL